MNRRTLLAGIIASPFLSWLGFKSKPIEAAQDILCENIEDGDCGTLLYYNFEYSESKRIKNPQYGKYVDFPPIMKLQLIYLKDGLEIEWDWHCINPKFDGYPFNIKKFISSPQMDKNGIRHSHSNICDVPYRMYGQNKFLLSSINITNPFLPTFLPIYA